MARLLFCKLSHDRSPVELNQPKINFILPSIKSIFTRTYLNILCSHKHSTSFLLILDHIYEGSQINNKITNMHGNPTLSASNLK